MSEIDRLVKKIDDLENTLKVILCCSLLPKDGPNWDFYESLFSEAEIMITDSDKGLTYLVHNILNNRNTMDSLESKP